MHFGNHFPKNALHFVVNKSYRPMLYYILASQPKKHYATYPLIMHIVAKI